MRMEPIDPKTGEKTIWVWAEVGQIGPLPPRPEGDIEEMAGIITRTAVLPEADRQGRTIDPPSRIDIPAMPTSVVGVI